jgi:dihydroflavonol-4-reductase
MIASVTIMRIFITGATGFIGSRFVRRMAGKGHELVCLARPTSNTAILAKNKCAIVEGDVTDRDSVERGMRGCDCAVNLAALYSLWEADPSVYHDVNVTGTRNVMEAALEHRLEKVVHISTVVVYGKPDDTPFTEESAPGPVRFSEYGRTKYEGEMIAWDLFEGRGLPLVVIYPAVVVGPGDTKATEQYAQLIKNRKLPALACVDSIFTWVHVDDVAAAIEKALTRNDTIGKKYIIGNKRLTIGDYYKTLFEGTGVNLPRIILPDWMASAASALLTLIANIFGRPPLWAMSTDQIATMKAGIIADGSLAEKELGLRYRSIFQE